IVGNSFVGGARFLVCEHRNTQFKLGNHGYLRDIPRQASGVSNQLMTAIVAYFQSQSVAVELWLQEFKLGRVVGDGNRSDHAPKLLGGSGGEKPLTGGRAA